MLYNWGVAEAEKIDFNDPAPIFDEGDLKTLAAIERGIQAADGGRVVSLDDARRMDQWLTESSSPKTP
jgi:predicted transcriptional regulator